MILHFSLVGINGDISLALMPSFVEKHMKNIGNNSLIYLSSCQSLQNKSLSDAFISKGAASIVEHTRNVSLNFASTHETAMFNILATGRSTDQMIF